MLRRHSRYCRFQFTAAELLLRLLLWWLCRLWRLRLLLWRLHLLLWWLWRLWRLLRRSLCNAAVNRTRLQLIESHRAIHQAGKYL